MNDLGAACRLGFFLVTSMLMFACAPSVDKNSTAQQNAQQPSGPQTPAPSTSPSTPPAEPVSVTAQALVDEVLKDRDAAEQKYSDLAKRGVKLRVTGKVFNVAAAGEFPGTIVDGKGSSVVLRTNKEGSWVSCTASEATDNSLSDLKPGQPVAVVGSFGVAQGGAGIFARVALSQCKLQ